MIPPNPATPATPATPLRINLFGAFEAQRNGVTVEGLRRRDGERLLVYLVLHASQPTSSKELAQRFWPFEAQANALGHGDYPNVRQALHSLRQALGPDAEKLTRQHRAAVQLDLTGIEVDIQRFDHLSRAPERATGVTGDPESPGTNWPVAYAEAVALYKGPLLEAWNEPWLIGPRKNYQRLYEMMLRRLVGHASEQRQPDALARWTSLLLQAAPDDEQVQRDLRNLGRIYVLANQSGGQVAPEQLAKSKNDSTADHSNAKAEEKADDTTEETEEAETLSLDAAGGAVPLTSRFYIEREVDGLCQNALKRQDGIVLLKGARQVGKTSLLARLLHTARQRGVRVAVTDFQKINAADFATPDTLYRSLATSLARQLKLSTSPRDVWDEDFSPNMNFEQYLCSQVLEAQDTPVVWAMDEVDRLLICPFGSEVFGLFRSWYNERSLDPDSILARLSLVISYATEAHLFIADLNQSPFNVGTRLGLTDFTREEVEELNRRYQSLLSAQELTLLYENLSGHPYLTRRALDEVASGTAFTDVLANANDVSSVDGIFGDHLRRLWLSVAKSPQLLSLLQAVLSKESRLTLDDFYRLRAAGILAGSTPQSATFRCRLYESYFAHRFAELA